jgi:hypothetical protein
MSAAESVRAYLEEVLAMDPLHESKSIVRARNLQFGLTKPAAKASVRGSESSNHRAEVYAALDLLRSEAAKSGADALIAGLDAVEAGGHPDLEDWKQRLIEFATVANEFDSAREDRKISKRLLSALTEIATAPATELVSLRTGKLNGLDSRHTLKGAKQLRKNYASLYALDPEWFERVMSIRRDRKLQMSTTSVGAGFFLIWIVFRLIARLFRD